MPAPAKTSPASKTRLLVAGGLVLLGVAIFAVYTLWLAGEFRTLTPHFNGTCKTIKGVIGAEDLALDAVGAQVFISAMDRRAAASQPSLPGALWRLDLATPDAEPQNLTPSLPFPFRPHGLGLARAASETVLMVVNHRSGGVLSGGPDTIEVFQVANDGKLRHKRSVSDPLLVAVNDVAPTRTGRFYASIDHGQPKGLLRQIEDLTRRPWSSLVMHDGKAARTVAKGLRYANGLALSADEGELYATGTVDRAVFVYRTAPDGGLRQIRRIETETGVDNITVDEQGLLWIGAHPKLLTFVRHAADPAVRSPSQVLRVDPRTGQVDEILLNDGMQLSASAAAVPWRGRLLVSPVFDPHLLDCQMRP